MRILYFIIVKLENYKLIDMKINDMKSKKILLNFIKFLYKYRANNNFFLQTNYK